MMNAAPLPQERRLERMSDETLVFLYSFLDWVWQGAERTSPERQEPAHSYTLSSLERVRQGGGESGIAGSPR